MKEKIRMVCLKCLRSKKMDKIKEDPNNTKIITSDYCDECCENERDMQLRYFDSSMREINTLNHDE